MSNQRDKLNDLENVTTIVQACTRILSYTDGMDWDDFVLNNCIVDACAMNCLVIGERASKLSYEFKQHYNGLPWIELEDFSHRVANTYDTDSFDLNMLWTTIVKDIPTTLDYCQYVLDDYDSNGSTIRSLNPKRILGRKRNRVRFDTSSSGSDGSTLSLFRPFSPFR